MNTRILGTSQITVNQIMKYIEMLEIDRDDLYEIVSLYKKYADKYYVRFDVAVLMFLYYGMKTQWNYIDSDKYNLCGIGFQPVLLENKEFSLMEDGTINCSNMETFTSIENFIEAHCQILYLITRKTSGELLDSFISKNAPLIAFQSIPMPEEIMPSYVSSESYDVFYLSYLWFPEALQYDHTIYKSYKEAHDNKDTFGWFLEIGTNILNYIEEDESPSINSSKLIYFVDFGGYTSFEYSMAYKNKLKTLVKNLGYRKNVSVTNESGRYKIRIGYFTDRDICTKIRLYLYAYGYYGKLNYKIKENA